MKRPQLTCILGAEKNSGGIKSRRSGDVGGGGDGSSGERGANEN